MNNCAIIIFVLMVNVANGNNAPNMGFQNTRIMENEITEMLECLRGVLKNGMEDVGLPSFEPLEVDNLLINLTDLNIPHTTGFVKLNDLSIAGITDWDISNLSIKIGIIGGINVNLLGNLVFPKIAFHGAYHANLTAMGVKAFGDGEIVAGFGQSGMAVDVQVFLSRLNVSKFRVLPSLQSIKFTITGFLNDTKHSEMLSEIVNSVAVNWVNGKSENMADAIEQYVQGLINKSNAQNDVDVNEIINAIIEKCPLTIQ